MCGVWENRYGQNANRIAATAAAAGVARQVAREQPHAEERGREGEQQRPVLCAAYGVAA